MTSDGTVAAVERSAAGTQSGTQAALPVALAFLLGAFLVYGAGFAQPQALHNAAHDSRHAFAFPCH